jgi:GNAT superfamily N-acetyltransferase
VPGIGEIKRLWVAESARGMGIGQRLLTRLEEEARKFGHETMRLDTNRLLTKARALYLKNGYREVPRFNDDPYPDHWFEKDLT